MVVDNGDVQSSDRRHDSSRSNAHAQLLYSVNAVPPWYLSILLGLQHYLTAAGSMIAIPAVVSQYLCIDEDRLGMSEMMGTVLVVSGLSTLIQSTFGVRLPIIQGVSASFLVPTISILQQEQWKCPHTEARNKYGAGVNFTAIGLPEIGSDGHREIWQSRLREIQGAIMVAALMQAVIGFSGIMGFVLRFIGPLSITPTIALIGLSLFNVSSRTMFLITLFSQYLRNIRMKFVKCTSGNVETVSLPVFNLFPVLLAIVIAWLICYILTETNVLPDTPGDWGYLARTDRSADVLQQASWFRFPYPGQWGAPTVSVASGLVMFAAVLPSVVESIGDYYACAKLSGAPPPPIHAVNRGIGIEGIGCLLAGAWGSGNGTTSFSQNVGIIGITKVGSRRVVQVGGVIMLLLGCLGKFGALFSSIPGPVIGGVLITNLGMVTAVGLSNLQYINMNSPRNIFIVGVSILFGLSLPKWIESNRVAIDTGNNLVNQILSGLCGTSLFVGGFIGFLLDNTIPGTPEERGIRRWREDHMTDVTAPGDGNVYDIPFIQKFINKWRVCRYIPVCPTFLGGTRRQHDSNQTPNDHSRGYHGDNGNNEHLDDTRATCTHNTRF